MIFYVRPYSNIIFPFPQYNSPPLQSAWSFYCLIYPKRKSDLHTGCACKGYCNTKNAVSQNVLCEDCRCLPDRCSNRTAAAALPYPVQIYTDTGSDGVRLSRDISKTVWLDKPRHQVQHAYKYILSEE